MTALLKNLVRPGDGDPRHGRASTYQNHACRCDLCRAAWSEYIPTKRFGPDVDMKALRAEFLRLLTEDGPTTDRRRRDYNQAIFMPDGPAVWSSTTLDMVMDKFDRAVKAVQR